MLSKRSFKDSATVSYGFQYRAGCNDVFVLSRAAKEKEGRRRSDGGWVMAYGEF
jgi:hypothetical protein